MVTRIPQATTGSPVSDVIEDLRGRKYECADTVFITDPNGRLEGIVRINGLAHDIHISLEPDVVKLHLSIIIVGADFDDSFQRVRGE